MAGNHEFDIVVWGATGFLGRRVAYHLASRSDSRTGLRWALGGRDRARLESVRSELGSAAKHIPIVTGDSHDVASLDALAARTAVVCSTVGPYAKYGSELVGACVRRGTHYCDLTGEASWMRMMIDAHQIEAERSGARIVHACGFDSIPSDLGVFFLQNEARQRHGRPCSHVKMMVAAMRGGFSGGTVASLVHMAEEGGRDPSLARLMTEPYSLNPEGQRQGPDLPERMMPLKVRYDDDLRAWTMPFFMGPINGKIVRRSNALLGYPYGKDFRYEEAILTGGGPAGWTKAAMGAVAGRGFMLAMGFSPTRRLMQRYLLPGPGQGPSQSVRENGYYDLILIGNLVDGSVMRARVRGDGDPGTESTSRLLVESALCLAQDSDWIAVDGGFWTPASAMGALLLSRLTAHGILSFEIE